MTATPVDSTLLGATVSTNANNAKQTTTEQSGPSFSESIREYQKPIESTQQNDNRSDKKERQNQSEDAISALSSGNGEQNFDELGVSETSLLTQSEIQVDDEALELTALLKNTLSSDGKVGESDDSTDVAELDIVSEVIEEPLGINTEPVVEEDTAITPIAHSLNLNAALKEEQEQPEQEGVANLDEDEVLSSTVSLDEDSLHEDDVLNPSTNTAAIKSHQTALQTELSPLEDNSAESTQQASLQSLSSGSVLPTTEPLQAANALNNAPAQPANLSPLRSTLVDTGLNTSTSITDNDVIKLDTSGASLEGKAQASDKILDSVVDKVLKNSIENARVVSLTDSRIETSTPAVSRTSETTTQLPVVTNLVGNNLLAQTSTDNKPLLPTSVIVGQQQWGQHIAERTAWIVSQNISSADIQLDPPELGPLAVRVNVQNDQASVSFVVTNNQVKDAMDQTLSRLKDLMEEQGFDLVDVDVSDQSQTQGEQDEATANNQHEDNSELEILEPGTLPGSAVPIQSGIDHFA